MTKLRNYTRATSLAQALEARRAEPRAAWLAGGTLLLAGDGRDKPESVIDIGLALPRELAAAEGLLSLGAGASFQELAESRALPAYLVEAALSMANRNTRNRATLGGNLAADKSCSSLVPLLLALEAELELLSPLALAGPTPAALPSPERLGLEAWLLERSTPGSRRGADLVLRVLVSHNPARRAAYRRWNRVACDLSVLGAAAAYELEGGLVRRLRLALGGLGPQARRFPELEQLFEGSALPPRERIEAMVSPLLKPIDDLRASAAFKRLRGAQLVAEALLEARSEGSREARP
jgi:CO/xanthine dehydrogenase FAD-binding subunit